MSTVKKIIFRAKNGIIRPKAISFYKQIVKESKLAPQVRDDLVFKRLQHIVKNAFDNTPFYHELYSNAGLKDGIISSMNLSTEKAHYIRLERIGVRLAKDGQPAKPTGNSVLFDGVIESQEYYGLFIKYTIQAAGQTLKAVEKNDGINIYEPGDKVNLLIDPADIMSY